MTALLVGIIFCCCGAARGLHIFTGDRVVQSRVTSQRRWLQSSGQASRGLTKVARQRPLASSSTPTEDAPGRSASGTRSGFGSRSSRRKRGRRREDGAKDSSSVEVLKRSSRWACVKGCGACCYLALDQRPDMEEFLRDPQELAMFKSMAAEDGWCVNFDKGSRSCKIYDDRPRFCRVEAETFGDMYGVEPEEMDDFCASCCRDQIDEVYGSRSTEMRAFTGALAALARGERPVPERNPFGGDEQAIGKQIRDWGLDESASDAEQG